MATSAWWRARIEAWMALLNAVTPPLTPDAKAQALGAFITAMLSKDTFEP